MATEASAQPQLQANHRDFWLLFWLFLSFRLFSLILFRPGGFIRDWSDFDTFLGIAALSDYDLYPFVDFWLEWPPLVPWLMVGAYKLSLLLPPWEEPRLWFVLILGTVFVLFEAGNFALLYRVARRLFSSEEAVTRILWLYGGLFFPVYTLLGFFDVLALFFMLLSLALVIDNKMRAAAVAIGVGFLVKVTPVLLLPVALRVSWHRLAGNRQQLIREWLLMGLILAATILLLLLPFLLTSPEWLAAFLRALFGRSSWETIWAALEGYYGFGFVAGDRLNPAETNFAIHPATLPWGLITLVFAALFGVVFFLRSNLDYPRRIVALAGLIVSLFLLYSKGYSPQFLIYLLPFVILLLPNLVGLGYALLLMVLNLLEQPLYFVFFPPDQFPNEAWLLTAIVTARFIVLVVLSLEFLFILRGEAAWEGPVRRVRQSLRYALAAGAVIGLLLLLLNLFSAYNRAQLARSPHQALIGFLQAQTSESAGTLLLTEQPLYRALYPHLRQDYSLKLMGNQADFQTVAGPNQLLDNNGPVWFLPTGSQQATLSETVESLTETVAIYEFAGTGTLSLLDTSGSGTAQPLARAENGVALLAYDLQREESTLRLSLFWQAAQPPQADYTVFTQLLDGTSQLVNGHDGFPADGTQPTSGWLPNEVILDRHMLTLPPDFAAADYQVVVGMYDAQGERLPFRSAEGQAFANDAIPLKSIP